MNDFTKKELEELLKDYQRGCTYQGYNANSKLVDKLRFMINNYCERDLNSEPYEGQFTNCNLLTIRCSYSPQSKVKDKNQ